MKKIFVTILLIVYLLSSCTLDNNLKPPMTSEPSVTAILVATNIPPPIAGDLGLGKIHGKITDTATGEPIVGAIITCEHHSYTSPATCSGTATTDFDGVYIFEDVFFHDTDTIKLIVEAAGYQTEEIKSDFFTMADMEANVGLNPTP